MRKGKQDKIVPDNKSEKLPVCHVCWTKDPQDKTKSTRPKQIDQQRKKLLELHSCTVCKVQVHKHCYDPSLSQTTSWKCDFCKSPKSKNCKQECFICKCEGKMLKIIDENKYAHVHCALSNDMIILENFKTLKFKLNPEFKPKQAKQGNSRSKEKDNSPVLKCARCKKDTSEVFKCYNNQCNFAAHIPCVLQYRFEYDGEDDIVFNLLNETTGSFRVKNHQFLKKNAQNLRGMQMLEKSKRLIPYLTCQPHSHNIKWCAICFKFDPDTDANMSECSRCYRWSHNECSKMKNKSENAYFQCDACMDNKIFLQRALFPDQINRMVKIQTAPNKWTRDQIKYLDSFAFKISSEIGQQILKNKNEFQAYHLQNFLEKEYLMNFETKNGEKDKKVQPIEKIIEKILEKIANHMKEFNAKKIIQILYFMKHKEFRSRNELNTAKDINDLRDAYPKKQARNAKVNAFRAAEQQKCRRILNCLLDCYVKNLKQVELKDISMKLVEFSDNIRKEIAIIKDSSISANDGKKVKKNENAQTLVDMLKKRPYRIAQEVRQMLKMITQNKQKFKGKFDVEHQCDDQNNSSDTNIKRQTKSKLALQNNFLMTLIRCVLARDEGYESQMFDTEDLIDLLDSYRKIIYISRVTGKKPQRKLTLSDEEFYKMMNKSYDVSKTIISEESKIRIAKYFKSLTKEHNIKQPHQIKSEMTQKYDQLVQMNNLNYNQTMIMRENFAEFGVFIDKHSKLMNIEKRSIYFRVLKIKYMKIIRLELESDTHIPDFPLKPNQKLRKQIIENAKRLLDANGTSIKLTQNQKKNLEYYLVKEEVFSNILREELILGAKLEPYNPEKLNQSSRIQVQGEEGLRKNQTQTGTKTQLTVLQRIKRIFNYWMDNHLQNPYQIIKIISPIAQKNIMFPFEYQAAFNDLIESIGQRIDILLKLSDQYNSQYGNAHKVNSDEFMKLWKLIEYAQLERSFDNLRILSEEYKEWASDFDQRYNPISKVLEDKFLNSQLLEVIDKKITDAERFSIDLKTEVKKLKIVKLWAVLSEKFQKDLERKATINAIQHIKQYMIKVNYPHNAIFKQVTELEIYGRTINERIQKYLKKQKLQDLEYYEEICLLNLKMSLRQAEELKIELQNGKLDVSAETSMLEDEITNFYQIPTKLEPILKKEDNLEELMKIKTKILQSPIKFENMDAYCQLYHRISFLKCKSLQGNINKKEFFRLLNTSEIGALILTERFPLLLKAYRQIERAEKEASSIKPNFELLLPLDGKKLKEDLGNDQLTLVQIEKLYTRVNSLREKFKNFKYGKQLYERYVILENQLSRLPVNYKDVQIDIHKMKSELDILVDRSMMLKKNFNPKQAKQVVFMYNRQGIKHPELESIKKVNEAYSICMSLSEKQEDYVEFSQKCKDYSELDSIITLNEMRNQLFGQYSEEALEQKADAGHENKININFLNALINEGAFLLRHVISSSKHHTQIRQKNLTTLLKINQKIQEITKSSTGVTKAKKSKRPSGDEENAQHWQDQYDSAQYDEDGSGQNEDGFDDDQEEEMEDYDEDDEMRYDDDYDDQEEESVPQPPKKRSQPMVMQISDEDDQQQAAEPRKVVHQNPTLTEKKQVSQIIEQSQEAQQMSSSQK